MNISEEKFEFLIITGMSGAGKSQAINFFEDRDYFCIDNLPISLLSSFVKLYSRSKGKIKKLAFVIDIRSWNFVEEFFDELKLLRESNVNYKIIFLDSKDEILLSRYNLTRRKHPLTVFGGILENIKEERRILQEIRDISSIVIDTSDFILQEFRARLEKEFSYDNQSKLHISFISFGFKYGNPIDLDLLFDVRFLPNPYYIDSLKFKTGNDIEIEEYVFNFEDAKIFYEKLMDMLDFLLPQYTGEGKSHLSIGIGCSGGKHRSVSITNKLYTYYAGQGRYSVRLEHRDIEKKTI